MRTWDVKRLAASVATAARENGHSTSQARAAAHAAATGYRIAIAAYLGAADTFDRAVADFALAYADRTAADHRTLGAAIAAGTVTAEPGV